MASRWVHGVDGQLINLDRCTRIAVEKQSAQFAVVAFAPAPLHYVLARLPTRELAEEALQRLAGILQAAPWTRLTGDATGGDPADGEPAHPAARSD